MTGLDYLSIAAVLLIGVPHGGLDGAVARRVGWPNSIKAWIAFHLSYILIAALVSIFWWIFPLASMTLFLIISGIHFGVSDIRHIMEYQKNHWLPIIAHGGLVCIAIPGFQLSAVAPIFKILIGEDGGSSLLQAINYLLYPYLAIVIIYFVFSLKNREWKACAVNLFSLLLIALLLPPLLSFALYFCFWHSRSHVLRIWENIKPEDRKKSLVETFAYSGAAWLAALCFFWYFRESPDYALLKLTFIGLAALTVPHMILVDFLDSKLHRLIS
tara:strand:- start:635 stop:1447 length:813 start_codon:yes stop_codon:yes gene_type:complete